MKKLTLSLLALFSLFLFSSCTNDAVTDYSPSVFAHPSSQIEETLDVPSLDEANLIEPAVKESTISTTPTKTTSIVTPSIAEENAISATTTTSTETIDPITISTPTIAPTPVEPQKEPAVVPLSNDNYYTNVDGNEVHSPAYAPNTPAGATAECRDGTYSFSQHRSGTCSHHGGVARWL